MPLQLALRLPSGQPTVTFHDTVDEALRAAWEAAHTDPPATPLSISDNNTLVYNRVEIEAVTALYADVNKWPGDKTA